MTDTSTAPETAPIYQPDQLLDILLYPDHFLRQTCQAVTDINGRTQTLIDKMFNSMYNAEGVGLAAAQVNTNQRLFVVDVSEHQDQPYVFINPTIVESDGEIQWNEGCLSIPGVHAQITRPEHILVQALDREGSPFEIEANGLFSVCIQHEIDHLNGVLFVDHLSRLKRDRALKKMTAADYPVRPPR